MIKKKHLLRCNAQIERKVKKDKRFEWVYDGFIEFETFVDVDFLLTHHEEVLNVALKKLVEKQNTSLVRYNYIDFDLEYHKPKKLTGNLALEYKKQLKRLKDLKDYSFE